MQAKQTIGFSLILLLLAPFWAIQQPVYADAWHWIQRAGGIYSYESNSIAVDALGNTYVTGKFNNKATFGNFVLNNGGAFVAKYDPTGDVLWAKEVHGNGYVVGYGIAVDAVGNTYITGCFDGSVTFDTLTMGSAGGTDIFVTKYDPTGQVLWAKRAGSSLKNDKGFGISVDTSGNTYIAGLFADIAIFDNDTLTAKGGDESFVAKYDPNGQVLWAKQSGGAYADGASCIALDPSGNAYVAGRFSGPATFDTVTLSSAGGLDIFVAKYDANGNVLWAQRAGGTGFEYANGIAVDAMGNAYLTGRFDNAATFGTQTITTAGSNDVFVAKYASDGQAQWVQQAGGTGNDEAYDIAVDGAGNAYITGRFSGTATLGTYTLSSAGGLDILVAKYDATGQVLWAQRAGGTGSDYGLSIALDASGNSYLTGLFGATATFGPFTLGSFGLNSDIFVAKISGTVTALDKKVTNTANIIIHPNPTYSDLHISTGTDRAVRVRLYDLNGKQLVQQVVTNRATLQLQHLPKGMYILQVVDGKQSSTHKVMVQ